MAINIVPNTDSAAVSVLAALGTGLVIGLIGGSWHTSARLEYLRQSADRSPPAVRECFPPVIRA